MDPDSSYIIKVSLFFNNTKRLLEFLQQYYSNLDKYLFFSIHYYSPIVKSVRNSLFYLYAFHFLMDPDPELIISVPG